jgi:glycosyltransferase involved in cell wall biosynthesis
MKVLLVNQAFVSPAEPGHTRHFELARYFQQAGHQLTIIGSDLNYQTGRKILKHRGLSAWQDVDGVRILRASILPALHHSYFLRVLSFISFMFSAVIASFKVKEVDLVMATTPPLFQAFATWFIAVLRRKPFLLEVRDLWPEFAIGMGVIKSRLVISLSRWLESFLYARARIILVNSPAYVDYMLSRGVPSAKIRYIPYGTDTSMFSPAVLPGDLRSRFDLSGKFLALYAGALGAANDIPTLLRAAQLMQDQPDFRLVLLGDGKERPSLEAEGRRLGLQNVIFAGAIPKSEMPGAIACADVCLAILQDIPMFRSTYPNKVFDYMAAGKPTVLAIDGVIRQLVEEAQAGTAVPPDDPAALAQCLSQLMKDPARLASMGQNAREYICRKMDRNDKMAETLTLMLGMVQK